MKNKILLILFLSVSFVSAQKLELDTLTRKQRLIKDPLTPSKAAFYSAIVPGLGQIYTGKYWKVPIIYGGLGASGYFYFYQTKQMNSFRDIYKRRIAGYTDDKYANRILQNDQLIQGMNFHKRYRDLAVLYFMGFYLLNILDANVGAHLMQFNVNDQLTLRPQLEPNLLNTDMNYGLTLNIKF
ncbi:MAG: DUF5683 domain-containing protein [Flavobacteriaceae bacterium]|nr:DUF5683 domain-containing protein [Flavobacteriaceae bacterium]